MVHLPIILSAEDISLTSFPHTDAMVITTHIGRWDVSRIIIDNARQAEILFLSTFERMGYDKNQLKELAKPLYGFDNARIKPLGVIAVPISFITPKKTPHRGYRLRRRGHAIPLQCHHRLRLIEYLRSHIALSVSLPENPSYLRHYNHTRKSERGPKH
jgi:hypothetical protein